MNMNSAERKTLTKLKKDLGLVVETNQLFTDREELTGSIDGRYVKATVSRDAQGMMTFRVYINTIRIDRGKAMVLHGAYSIDKQGQLSPI